MLEKQVDKISNSRIEILGGNIWYLCQALLAYLLLMLSVFSSHAGEKKDLIYDCEILKAFLSVDSVTHWVQFDSIHTDSVELHVYTESHLLDCKAVSVHGVNYKIWNYHHNTDGAYCSSILKVTNYYWIHITNRWERKSCELTMRINSNEVPFLLS